MDKYYLTYSESKDLNKVIDALDKYFDRNNFSKITLEYVKKLCGTFAYAGLFVLPEHMLYDGAKYTIPEICIQYKGLVAHDLYEFLNNMGAIATTDDTNKIIETLKTVLNSCLFTEVVQWLNVSPTKAYIALSACLAVLCNDSDLYNLCVAETSYPVVWKYVTANYLGGLIE